MILLINRLVDARVFYSQHKFDVGRNGQKFHVTLKTIVELKQQRSSKVPLHWKEKLRKKQLTQLKDAYIIHEMCDVDELRSLLVNPITLMPKNDNVNLVIDARYFNFVTDLTIFSRPIKTVQMIMTRVNSKFLPVSDLSCAYLNINIVNSCNFFLSEIEEMKSCIYCIKAANTWVRL